MMFRIEPRLLSDLFSSTEPIEEMFPHIFHRFGFVDMRNEYPHVNVAEYKDEIEIEAELPGVTKEDVKVAIHDGVLTISGERKSPDDTDKSRQLRQEISYGSFSRAVRLPEIVDAEKASAEFRDGVLRIRLPKHEAAKPKEIAIR